MNQWVLGEDSGIVVDALGGAPGIYSARYSGPGATDQTNNDRLLAELGDTPLERRTAHYVCQMALADRGGTVRATSGGECHGRIRFEPAGSAGFGYDPLFEIIECAPHLRRAGRDGQKRAEPPRPGRREDDPATDGAFRQRAVGVSVNSVCPGVGPLCRLE